MAVVVLVPPSIQELVQQGAVERAFHDGLYPNLAYRAEAMAEEWPANTGQLILMSRPGLLTPKVRPLTPGSDPQPSIVPYEQWSATLSQFADAVDTPMLTAITAAGNLFLRNIQQLGLGAGQSVNHLARNNLFIAYLSGQTCLIAATLTTDTQIRVGAINGFTDVLVPGPNQVAPRPVSPANPLSVTVGIGAAAVKVNVIGAVPDIPADTNGPGTLLLSAAIGTAFANRTAVISSAAPRIVRTGGGASVDAIGPSDTVVLQDVINACALLRRANVLPHEDGYYHAHISPLSNSQLFADNVLQRLNTALPEGIMYSSGFVGHISGILFFMNTESPDALNTGTRVFNGPNFAQYSPEIGAETTNDGQVDIGRIIVTGKGALYERYLDESQLVTEAGVTGAIGTFDVVNQGIQILTERIRLILRSPQDRLQQVVSSAWSITTSFPVPSDITAPSGPERFKRAVVIEHAL
jgi:hypothetical protein